MDDVGMMDQRYDEVDELLDAFDDWATEHGLDAELEATCRSAPTIVEDSPPWGVDLTRGDIRTIVWATGFRPDYSWAHAPVLDRKVLIRPDGGLVIDAPGMYLMGMPFLRRRKSTLIDGAEDLSTHLTSYRDGRVPALA